MLMLPYNNAGNHKPQIVFDLRLAPYLNVSFKYQLKTDVFVTSGAATIADNAIVAVFERWLESNRVILLAICTGEFSLARAVLDIELGCGGAGLAMVDVLGPPETLVDERIVEAVKLNLAMQPDSESLPLSTLALGMQRRRIVGRHRRAHALGTGKLLGIVY